MTFIMLQAAIRWPAKTTMKPWRSPRCIYAQNRKTMYTYGSRATMLCLSLIGALTLGQAIAQNEPIMLEVSGQVRGSEKKLAGCSIVIHEGNKIVGQQLTPKSGNFGFLLELNKEYAIVFSKDGYQRKSILIDTHAKLPAGTYAVAPFGMDLHMLPLDKYTGIDTDVLDFPYAIVKWDMKTMVFAQDEKYTGDMMRINGALLLQSGRATKE